jgi:Xaa-Pro aminopeptidase
LFEIFEFGKEERDKRWQQVRNSMRKRGIGALIIWGFAGYNSAECANFRYLSNMATYGNLSYPGYLIFPLEDEPTIIGFAKMPAADSLWIKDIRGKFPSYSKAIIDRLNELRVEKASIGIISYKGIDAEEGFPYATFMALKEGLPEAQFQDAVDILDDTRRIKSDAEIRCLELGCEAANEATKAILATARAGVRNCEVVAKILEALTRNGCETDSLFLYGSGKEYVDSGKGVFLYPRYLRTLEKGDIIHMEYDAKYNGYTAQQNQMFAVGKPSKEWLDITKVDVMAYENGLKVLKPGVTLGELNKAFLSVIMDAGYVNERPGFHGLGLSTERPPGGGVAGAPCVPSDSFKMLPGMVLELEPHTMSKDRKYNATLGCPVLVTETGNRPLNKAKVELRICE